MATSQNSTNRRTALRRTMPEPAAQPETAKASVLRTLANETRRLATMPDAAFEDKKPAPTPEQRDLRDVSEDLGLVHDLLDAAYFAANSLPSGLGKEPMTRLLNLIIDKLADAHGDLDRIREAASKAA